MHQKNPAFTLSLLMVCYYSAQMFNGTYVNLYFAQIGISKAGIGLMVSISTFIILSGQMLWGAVSDRVRRKNSVLLLIFLCGAAAVLLFYGSQNFFYLLAVLSLFTFFLNPAAPLLDNFSLEVIEEHRPARWDYGRIRMFGTLGYCVTSLVSGFLIRDHYRVIFVVISIFSLCCAGITLLLPRVRGHRTHAERAPLWPVLKNPRFLSMLLLSVAMSSTMGFFYNFYPMYYQSIGGNSSYIGVIMTFCAVTEIPCLLIAGRVVNRFGVRRVLIVSGLLLVLRQLLLFAVTAPVPAIAVNLVQGPGFIGINYSIVTYISRFVPKQLRATCQSVYAIVNTFFSRVLFGYLGGLGSQVFGVRAMLLFFCVYMFLSAAVFAVWFTRLERARPSAEALPQQG